MSSNNCYLVDCGVLLRKGDHEFESYCIAYDKQWGYYDENQFYVKTNDEALEFAKKYVNDGVENTYCVVSETWLPDDVDFDDCPVSDEKYSLDDIVFSVAKIDGEIKEGFINTSYDIEMFNEIRSAVENDDFSVWRIHEIEKLWNTVVDVFEGESGSVGCLDYYLSTDGCDIKEYNEDDECVDFVHYDFCVTDLCGRKPDSEDDSLSYANFISELNETDDFLTNLRVFWQNDDVQKCINNHLKRLERESGKSAQTSIVR